MSLPNLPNITLPGSIIDAATKAANSAKAAAEALVPTFDSLMSAAKTSVNVTKDNVGGGGGLFKDISSSISNVAGQFGIGTEYANTDAFNAYKKQVADAQKNALVDMAIAKAALAQKVKEATARGEAISPSAISAAMDSTKMLQNMQSNLTNPTAIAQLSADSAAAKAEAMSALKANTMLAMLSKPLPAAMAGAVGSTMNPDLVNNLTKLNVIKAQETSATQAVPGQGTPTDSIRPKNFVSKVGLDADAGPSITKPEVDKRVYTSEVSSYSDKKDAAKKAYLAYIGVTWNKGDPDISKEEKAASFEAEVSKVYDGVIGRAGANQDRSDANAISKAKKKEDRTADEQALIDKVLLDKETFYASNWWKTKNSLYDTYSNYFDNYKLVYDCWLNNGNRFALPAAVEKELKSG
jgi:hypothetical protein